MKTVYENQYFFVYDNGSGELFVEPKKAYNATIRISTKQEGLIVTAARNGTLTPWAVNGLPAFKIQ